VDIMEPIFRQGCPSAARCETLVAYTDFQKQLTVREAQY